MKRVLQGYIFRVLKIYNSILTLFIRYNYPSKKHPTIPEETVIQYNKSREKGARKTICYAPSRHMYFGLNGMVRACCINRTDVYGSIKEHSIQELWNSRNRQLLKQHIDDYNLSGGCKGCNQQLLAGNYKGYEGRLYDSFLPETASVQPTEMTFEISNTCNLECIMCNGHYSSSIRKNREKLPPVEDKYGADFLNSIADFIPNLKIARFIGGEPFLIPSYLEIIEHILEHNKKCKIYIQTNGSVLNNRVKRIIEQKNIHLSISIDSLKKDTFEYIRKNADFDRILEHLEYFKTRAINYNQAININFCVMINNWKEVPDILSFCNKNHFTITYIPVETPKHLNISLLPVHKQEEILSYYRHFQHSGLLAGKNANAEKYEDLVNFIKFNLENAKAKTSRIKELSKQELSVLQNILHEHLTHKVQFETDDITMVLHSIEQKSSLLDVAGKKIFLSNFIVDLEEDRDSIIIDYRHTDDWFSRFETTFEKYISSLDKFIEV